MHVWVVERLVVSEWESLDVAFPTRNQARAYLAWWRRAHPNNKAHVRKYIPEPTLEDFNTWFEAKYGARSLYEKNASMSDDEVLDCMYDMRAEAAKCSYPRAYINKAANMENERNHRKDWDMERGIALAAVKAALAGFKEKP